MTIKQLINKTGLTYRQIRYAIQKNRLTTNKGDITVEHFNSYCEMMRKKTEEQAKKYEIFSQLIEKNYQESEKWNNLKIKETK